MKYLSFCLFTVLAFSGCIESPPKADPGQGGAVREADGSDSDFMGLSLGQAESLAKKRSLSHRVVERDGKHFPVTMDYRPDRLSFSVDKNRITKVKRG